MATATVRLDSGVEIRTSNERTVATIFRLINTTIGADDLEFLESSQPWPTLEAL